MIGQSVAHYEITDKLGAGGMGEVYRATDTRLNRQVALKVLPPVFAQDAQRLGRFEQEAQAPASQPSQYRLDLQSRGRLFPFRTNQTR
ncbi:MAG: hypothetical protein WAO20_13870 [Acidobacteriota bacterium]